MWVEDPSVPWWRLKLKSMASALPCADASGFICFEPGCPSAVLSCTVLAALRMCHSRFGQLYNQPPLPALSYVWQHCPRSCGYCPDVLCTNPSNSHSANLARISAVSCVREPPPPDEIERPPTSIAVHELMDGRHAAIVHGARWSPPDASFGCASGFFRPMESHAMSQNPSCDTCYYDYQTTSAMVETLLVEHRSTLMTVFGATSCKAIRNAYTTRTSHEHSPDDVHFDICDPAETAHRASRGFQRENPFDPSTEYVPLTAIAFPHHRWPASWGGPLEFLHGECKRENLSFFELNDEPAALRILPLPHRTVLFRADLLHRATLPSDETGVAVDGRPGGNRFSTVLRMLCEQQK